MARRTRVPYGRTYYLSAVFRLPETGVGYDPGAVTFRLRKPDKTITIFDLDSGVVSVGDGVFRITFVANQAGLWEYAIEGRDLTFEAVLDPPGEIIVDRLGV